MGGTIYVVFFLMMGQKFPTKKQFAWLIPMAFLMFVSSNGIATYGLQFITSGLGALIAALYPLSVVLIERYYFKSLDTLSLESLIDPSFINFFFIN
jgi:drug/metabolite transporter (DMT)-like permease